MLQVVATRTVGIKGKRIVHWTRTRLGSIPGFVKAEEFEVKVVQTAENQPKTLVSSTHRSLVDAHDKAKYFEGWITGDFMYRVDNVIKIGCLVTRLVAGKPVVEYRVFETGHIDR